MVLEPCHRVFLVFVALQLPSIQSVQIFQLQVPILSIRHITSSNLNSRSHFILSSRASSRSNNSSSSNRVSNPNNWDISQWHSNSRLI